MRFPPRNQLVLALGFASISLGYAGDQPPIKTEDFAKLRALIKPRPDEEKWLQIPWSANLWEARKRAAAEGKPILLWEMDGHPLGCT